MKILLNVPYADIAIAKHRGARWDNEKKVWYVVDPKKPELFLDWMNIPNYLWLPTKSRPLKHKPFKVTQPRSQRKK